MASEAVVRQELMWLEREAQEHPFRHAVRLWLLVMLGYAAPLLVGSVPLGVMGLMVVCGVQLGLIWLILGIALSLTGLTISGVLLVMAVTTDLGNSDGLRISRQDAPELWKMLDEACGVVGVRSISELLLVEHFNAYAAQRRRWGLIGPWKNTVGLGVPLMMALSPEELRVVVAHELTHLRGRHSTVSVRFIRVYYAWERLAARSRLTTSKGTAKIWDWTVGAFVRWYAKRIAIVTLAIRRKYEYEADHVAIEAHNANRAGGMRSGATALARLDWVTYWWERAFLPRLWKLAGELPIPPGDVMERIAVFLQSEGGVEGGAESERVREIARRWRERERRSQTPITASHPCLRDRLKAVGAEGLLEEGSGITNVIAGSVDLLGPSKARVMQVMNARIKALMMPNWRQRHEQARYVQKGPDAAFEALIIGRSEQEREWERKLAEVERLEPEEACDVLREYVVENPEFGPALYTLGRIMVQQDDERGVAFVEKGMKADSECIGPGLSMLLDYYRQMGRDDEAELIRQRLEQFELDYEATRKERVTLSKSDEFEPHGLSPTDVEKLRRVLYRFSQVRLAWVARKRVRQFADKPNYVILITPIRVGSWLSQDMKREDRFLVSAIQSAIPLSCVVGLSNRVGKGVCRRMEKVCPQPVYDVAVHRLGGGATGG